MNNMSDAERPTSSRFVSSTSANQKIVEYYLKYAKDRDIEKYLRFTNPSSSTFRESEFLIEFKRLDTDSDENQPPATSPKSNDENSKQAQAEQINSAGQTPVKDREVPQEPPDSIAKSEKRLEWDSLGDVGYNKSSSTGNISSLERSMLKDLFGESFSETNISLIRSDEAETSSTYLSHKKNRRERWRQTLENLGKKYSSASASLDTQEFTEQPQSTPKLQPNVEKSNQTITHQQKQPLINLKMTGRLESTPKEDKSCQTSFNSIPTRVKLSKDQQNHSCQTSFDHASKRLQKAEKCSQTSAGKIKSQEAQTTLSSRAESFATQSSFEYHPGKSDSSKSSARRSILGEKNSNTSKSRPSSDSDKENRLVNRKAHKPKNQVDMGIKLLCSLIDAKNLTGAQKKTLAKKIFEKIMKEQSSTSTTSASITSRSSVFSAHSLNESLPPREGERQHREAIFISDSSSIQQMSEETQTDNMKEEEYQATTTTKETQTYDYKEKVYENRSRTVSEETQTEDTKGDENPTTASSSLEEPVTMREWLHPLTKSEKDYDKKLKKKSTQTERQKQLAYLEMEINRLEGLKNLLIQESRPKNRSSSSKSSTQSGNKPEVIYEETAEAVNPENRNKRTTRLVIYDEPTADVSKQQGEIKYKTTKIIIDEEERSCSSNSRKNRRSKLETPISSDSPECASVSAFANQLQKQFMENYSKKDRCPSEHYSEPRICAKPIFTRNPSYTSVASSDFCMSSEMSIPIVESSSTSTTTHQYDSNGCDSIEGVAVQTTYSVIKTDPIFGPRCKCICTCGKQCKCSCPRPTVRVSGKVYHQTVQVKPKALAYVIRFTECCDNGGIKVTEECVSLQQRLEAQKPDFCSKANQRREILQKLHKLRQERGQRIREIAECSNISSIPRKLKQLPSPPIKHIRICPTREMKGLTRKRYLKLPEVVQKQEREKLERRKRTTRIITQIFNKKLQCLVHKGKLSLEYSRTVI